MERLQVTELQVFIKSQNDNKELGSLLRQDNYKAIESSFQMPIPPIRSPHPIRSKQTSYQPTRYPHTHHPDYTFERLVHTVPTQELA